MNCEFACPSGQSVRQFFSKVDVSASSVEWVLIETKHHNCQRQQYLKWRFPMGSIPKYMFKFGWFGVTPFQETFILAAQTGHRRVVLISRHCSAWISLTCGPAGLDMAWQDLPDLAELQKANDNVQAFSCCGWMPLFETTGHLPVSHTSRNNLLRHRFFWTWNPDHNVRGLHDSSCPGKALLKTFCDALRKQRLERQKVQVQLVTGDFEWRWPTD